MEKTLRSANRRLRIDRIAAVVLFLSAMLLCFPARAENPHFATIDVPGTARTIAYDVNSAGDVVGVFNATCTGTSCSAPHGFILRSGASAPEIIDVPGAAQTRAYGINDAGDVVGDYRIGTVSSGFLLRAGSSEFVTARYQDGSFTAARTDLYDIDEQGNAVGTYDDPVKLFGQTHVAAFIWRNGSFRVLQAPFDSTFQTQLHGINAQGSVVGCYWTYAPSGNVMHGLAVTTDGTYLSEDFPGSMMSMNWRISDSSIRVGQYTDFDKTTHAYVLKDGEYESVDFPGAVYTDARGVAERPRRNRHGSSIEILTVGSYVDTESKTHGFLFTRSVRVDDDSRENVRDIIQLP
jgi:uncharacterized membrane protein